MKIKMPQVFGHFKPNYGDWEVCAEDYEGARTLYEESDVRAAIAAAVAKEREACAVLCERHEMNAIERRDMQPPKSKAWHLECGIEGGAGVCVRAIRARGDTPCN